MHEWLTQGSLTLKFCRINYTAFGWARNTPSPSQTNTRTHACKHTQHLCEKCEMNLYHVKALGNEGEACFCFHKQLLRFRPTACLGGGTAEAWELPSLHVLWFPSICWCGWFRLRCVDSLCFLFLLPDCVSRCVGEYSWVNYTLPDRCLSC